ncbi:hypothetical protein H8E88_11700 [candidate division KSB1 bacterium]|nr:hypothetical protein [candidate division KSB1 bacterium]MBL7093875.1 hypothetical protein [candidate division KSB1 bacterium]
MLLNFQEKNIHLFKNKYPDIYDSKFINLDFHSIPHYGDESEMEKIWCGARGKTMKGANTVQVPWLDGKTMQIVWTP